MISKYTAVLKYSFLISIFSLLFGVFYYANPSAVNIIFSEDGTVVLKSGEGQKKYTSGVVVDEGIHKKSELYFEKRMIWAKQNRKKINSFLYLESRKSVYLVSWLPWVFAAWLLSRTKFAAVIYIVSGPFIFMLVDLFIVQEVILMMASFFICYIYFRFKMTGSQCEQ